MAADDDQTMDRLRDLLGGVPPGLAQRAKETHRLVSAERELAEITIDSDLEELAVRSSLQRRRIRFECPGVSLGLEDSGDVVRGVVTSDSSMVVFLETSAGKAEVRVREGGLFVLDSIPSGPLRFLVGDDVVTQWITLRP